MGRIVGVGVIGMGWMGEAHSRAYGLVGDRFVERGISARLVACADADEGRSTAARARFGFEHSTADWREVVADPEIEAISITAPNDVHLAVIRAALEAGKDVLCEKPVGRTPRETLEAVGLARAHPDRITFVGYNYRWAPVVQHAAELIAAGALGDLTHYRGRFLNGYASDPDGVLSWRFQAEQGYGTLSDLLSHAIDMAHLLAGPVETVIGSRETFIRTRPLPRPGGTHYDTAGPDDPRGDVSNEDYVGALVRFRRWRARNARGLPCHHRLAVRPRVRGPRHEGRARLDLRADERAALFPARPDRGDRDRLDDRAKRPGAPIPSVVQSRLGGRSWL